MTNIKADPNMLTADQAIEWCEADIDFMKDKIAAAAFFAKMRISVPIIIREFRNIVALKIAGATPVSEAWQAYHNDLSGYDKDDLLIVEHAFQAGYAAALGYKPPSERLE